jgi:hypothetical protein
VARPANSTLADDTLLWNNSHAFAIRCGAPRVARSRQRISSGSPYGRGQCGGVRGTSLPCRGCRGSAASTHGAARAWHSAAGRCGSPTDPQSGRTRRTRRPASIPDADATTLPGGIICEGIAGVPLRQLAGLILASALISCHILVRRNNVRVLGRGEPTPMFAPGFGCDQNMWRLAIPAFQGTHPSSCSTTSAPGN